MSQSTTMVMSCQLRSPHIKALIRENIGNSGNSPLLGNKVDLHIINIGDSS